MALSRRVIGCALEVHNKLGCGFLESVYGNALAREFTIQRIRFGSQVPFSVVYKGMPIGKYVADLVVEDKLLLELKATESLTSVHVSQLLNYLNASGIQVGLLINFGARSLQVRRLLNGFGPDSLI